MNQKVSVLDRIAAQIECVKFGEAFETSEINFSMVS
ncbi:hypothetical protein SDC9_192720 [bioreactor metagenome]|uniref:Uncharacterized protein n=1 Tax=bioreactor metagenome TaxID=1076179 RepID=A0A645ICJ2_9ZZZZ